MSPAVAPGAADAAAWLKTEIDAGRLAPALDESQLATVAAVLLQGSSLTRTKKTAEARSLASAEQEASASGALD